MGAEQQIKIQFYTPDAGPCSNRLAEFRMDVPVPEWGGTLSSRGCIITGRDGRVRVLWPKCERHFHTTPGDRDTTERAEAWILSAWKKWRERR